jgi:hypothetical protein
MNNHFAWVSSIREGGLADFYERDFEPFAKANYPPLINESFYVSDLLAEKISPEDIKIKAALYKAPAILMETIVFVILGITLSPLLLLILLINPGIFYNTLLWGQTEGLMASLIVLSCYFCFRRNKSYLTWLFLILALLVKQSALIFFPLFFVFSLKQFGIKKSILPALVSIVVFVISFTPYYGWSFIPQSINFLLVESQGQSHQFQSSVNALNLWFLSGKNLLPDNLGDPVSYRNVGIGIMGFFYIYLLFLAFRAKLSFKQSLILAGLVNFAVFLFMTRVHERHLLPTLILLSPIIIEDGILGIIIYISISLISFYNMYLIWNEKFSSYNFEILTWLSSILIAGFLLVLFITRDKILNPKRSPNTPEVN